MATQQVENQSPSLQNIISQEKMLALIDNDKTGEIKKMLIE